MDYWKRAGAIAEALPTCNRFSNKSVGKPACRALLLALLDSTAAILLRKTRFSDTSLIVTWFTSAHGKIKTIAKGALRPKSRFSGALDLFYACEINVSKSMKSDLHTL